MLPRALRVEVGGWRLRAWFGITGGYYALSAPTVSKQSKPSKGSGSCKASAAVGILRTRRCSISSTLAPTSRRGFALSR